MFTIAQRTRLGDALQKITQNTLNTCGLLKNVEELSTDDTNNSKVKVTPKVLPSQTERQKVGVDAMFKTTSPSFATNSRAAFLKNSRAMPLKLLSGRIRTPYPRKRPPDH